MRSFLVSLGVVALTLAGAVLAGRYVAALVVSQWSVHP